MSDTEKICTCPVCGRLHRYLANNPPPVISGEAVTIPRAQYDALMAAAKALNAIHGYIQGTGGNYSKSYRQMFDAFAALRAAGIQTEEP